MRHPALSRKLGTQHLARAESFNSDVGLARTLKPTERLALQIRAEAFNIFNTPQFGLPGATIGTTTAGVISTVVTPERPVAVRTSSELLGREYFQEKSAWVKTNVASF